MWNDNRDVRASLQRAAENQVHHCPGTLCLRDLYPTVFHDLAELFGRDSWLRLV
jgi:hypothetical protein